MNIELSVEQDIQVMTKYRLTCEELFFIKCLRLAQNDDQYRNLEEFLSQYSRPIDIKDIITSLIEKKVLLKESSAIDSYDKLIKYPNNVIFYKTFHKSYLVDASHLFNEFRDHYPFNVYINGSPVDLRLINSKEYRNESDVANAYAKAINFDHDIHEKVIEALDFGVQNNLICTNMVTFIISKSWERIWRIMEGEDTSLTFNNVTVL